MSRFLLVPERCHRVYPAGSPCRNPAGQRGDAQQNRGYTDEDRKVDHALGNRVNGNHERKYPANRRAPRDCAQVLANDLQDDPTAGGSERQPNANLSRSPGHGVRNYGIDSYRREAKQEWPEDNEHPRGDAAGHRGQ